MSYSPVQRSSEKLSWLTSPCIETIQDNLLESILKYLPPEDLLSLRYVNHQWDRLILSIIKESPIPKKLTAFFQKIHQQLNHTQEYLHSLHKIENNRQLIGQILENQTEVDTDSLCYKILDVLLKKFSDVKCKYDFKIEIKHFEKKLREIDLSVNSIELKKDFDFFLEIENNVAKVFKSLRSSQDLQSCFIEVLCRCLVNSKKTTKALEIFHEYGCKNKNTFLWFLILKDFKNNCNYEVVFKSLDKVEDKQKMSVLLDLIFLALQKNDLKLVSMLRSKWRDEKNMLVEKLFSLKKHPEKFQSEINKINKILDPNGIVQSKYQSIDSLIYGDLNNCEENESIMAYIEETIGFNFGILILFNYYRGKNSCQEAQELYEKLLQTIREQTRQSILVEYQLNECKKQIAKNKHFSLFNLSSRSKRKKVTIKGNLLAKRTGLTLTQQRLNKKLRILNSIRRQIERINPEVVFPQP